MNIEVVIRARERNHKRSRDCYATRRAATFSSHFFFFGLFIAGVSLAARGDAPLSLHAHLDRETPRKHAEFMRNGLS